MSATSFEASLHGLVDDEIDAHRRADTLAKLALSPGDAEKLASWRRQNQMLRAAFAGVEAEAVPLSLSLVSTPPPVARPFAAARPAAQRPTGRRVAAALCCGCGGATIFALALWPTHKPPAVDPMPVAAIAPPPIEAANLLHRARAMAGSGTSRGVVLPDLSRAGLTLSSADVFDDRPSPVACGTYTAHGRGRLVLCALRISGDAWPSADPRVWRRGETLYSLAGGDGEAASPNVAAQVRSVMDAPEP